MDSETSLSTLEEGSCAGTPLEGEGEPAAASTAAAADFAAPDFFDFDEVKQLLPGVLQVMIHIYLIMKYIKHF